MANINQKVWRLLNQDLSLQKNLRRNLINIRALARFLINSQHLNASMDAVISSIRRYESEENFPETGEQVKELFSSATIFTKNHIASIVLKGDSEVKSIQKIFETTRKNFRLIRAKKYSKIMIDQAYLDKVLPFFQKKDIVAIDKDLSEIRIVIEHRASEVRGVLSRITNEIALHNVSPVEVLSCSPEFMVYVRQKDLIKAHNAVMRLLE